MNDSLFFSFGKMLSIHFFEPQFLTFQRKNRGNFGFPGEIPIYRTDRSQKVKWDAEKMDQRVSFIADWAKQRNVSC